MSNSNGLHIDNVGIKVNIPLDTDLNNSDFSVRSNKDNKIKRQQELKKLLLSEQAKLTENASKDIVLSPPIIALHTDIPIFRRGTINVLQGKFGTHKSRVAELFCSLLLHNNTTCTTDFAGFSRQDTERFAVIYIDTERNTSEEFPLAIQTIRERAGFDRKQEVPGFHYFSIKKNNRSERLDAVKCAIEIVRKQEKSFLFVVLDVVTDCVASFNHDSESMALFDYLGNLCDEFQVTFLLLIHENFGTEKARGHTGSEAANKASTVMQTGFERGSNGEETELIKLKCLKLRTAKKPSPIYLQYDPVSKGLISADSELISQTLNERRQKADLELLVEKLEELLIAPMEQKELIAALKSHFECAANTIKKRLSEIAEKKMPILNSKGKNCTLEVHVHNGKATIYGLVPVEEEPDVPF